MNTKEMQALYDEINNHRKYAEMVFGDNSANAKKNAMDQIKRQTQTLKELFASCSPEDKTRIQDEINQLDLPLLNKTAFATTKGIAFCSVFSPYSSPMSYVAARRLQQISAMEDEMIGWTVISADVSKDMYRIDDSFDFYFATQQFEQRFEIENFIYYNQISNLEWGKRAFKIASGIPNVEYIFSRSSPPASHIAALEYKKQNPQVKWFAEFSDPLSISRQNAKKVVAQEMVEINSSLENYYEDIELSVYELADKIIFTNQNQFEFMLNYCANDDAIMKLNAKHMVLTHPITDKRYCKIVNSDYFVPDNKINIAYFGIWLYKNRDLNSFFELANNPNVVLHLFAPKILEVKNLTNDSGDRIPLGILQGRIEALGSRLCTNSLADNLEFLNIATKMDYLYVEDLDFDGEINPYLPAKLADYLSTGSRIISKIKEGSAMSRMSSPKIIKIKDVDDEFLASLRKAAPNPCYSEPIS